MADSTPAARPRPNRRTKSAKPAIWGNRDVWWLWLVLVLLSPLILLAVALHQWAGIAGSLLGRRSRPHDGRPLVAYPLLALEAVAAAAVFAAPLLLAALVVAWFWR